LIQRGPRPADALALISITALDDGRLSFKARGILAHLLAQKQNYAVSVEGLARHGTDGKRAIESGLRELEEHGYLTRSTTLDGTPLLTATDTPGIGEPTPTTVPPVVSTGSLVAPADAPTHWMPSDAAIKTAKNSVEFMNWKLYISTYLVRCKERKTQPDSGEWLRWLLQEEQKLEVEEKRAARESGRAPKWYETA
jgi:hypothetical protein